MNYEHEQVFFLNYKRTKCNAPNLIVLQDVSMWLTVVSALFILKQYKFQKAHVTFFKLYKQQYLIKQILMLNVSQTKYYNT